MHVMKSRFIPRLLLLVCTLWLLGCGQKGPLYLPDKPAQPAESETGDAADN
jgi:predicted small lipoprotein YifL